MKQYQDSSIEFRGNQYLAKLPWRRDHKELQTNYISAKRRSENVIKRLRQNPEMLEKYGNIISEQERRGFIEPVNENKTSTNTVHYIPHHPVMKDLRTTPVQVVYDCSFRPSRIHPRLNEF